MASVAAVGLASQGGPAWGTPQTGTWFGAFVGLGEHTALDRRSAVTGFEAQIGRQLTLERVYRSWDDVPFIGDDDRWSRDSGRTLVLSWASIHEDELSWTRWSDIADGQYDADIDARAGELIAFGAPVFFTFDHEPERWVDKEGEPRSGLAPDFVRAYRHVVDRFRADGVTNATFVLTLTARDYAIGGVDQYDPGDGYYDVLAADGYNWSGCPTHPGPWRSFASIFRGFHDYGTARGLPLMVLEYGSQEDPNDPDHKAAWFSDAATTLESWPQVKAVLYFHASPDEGCTWWADSSPQALASFVAMGADPWFRPPSPGALPRVAIVSGPPDPSPDGTAIFRFVSEPRARFSCAVDEAVPVPCHSPVTYSGLAEGAHSFSVRAWKGGGGDAAYWSWRVEGSAPASMVAMTS